MSSTNKTTHYELPQFVENDIFNPLVDDNDAYDKIDTALYNIADAEADDAAEIVGIKGRLDTAEGKVEALETQNGNTPLTTVAQTLSGAVNELKSGEDSLDGRLDVVEDDINNVSTGLKAKVTALENQNGSEVLDTVANTLSGAVNELVGKDEELDAEDVKLFKQLVGSSKAVTANIILDGNFAKSDGGIQGGCYIGNNKVVVYFAFGDSSNEGKLKCFDVVNHTEEWSYTIKGYHGNAIVYRPTNNSLYICGCVAYGSDEWINKVVVVPLANPTNYTEIEAVTALYSIAYDSDTDTFYGMVSGTASDADANKLYKYNGVFESVDSIITLENEPRTTYGLGGQGYACIVDGIVYEVTWHDTGKYIFGNYLADGKVACVVPMPTIFNHYRDYGELEAVTYDFDNDRYLVIAGNNDNGVYNKRTLTIAEVGVYNDIVEFVPMHTGIAANIPNATYFARVENGASTLVPTPFVNNYTFKCFNDVLNLNRWLGGALRIRMDTSLTGSEAVISNMILKDNDIVFIVNPFEVKHFISHGGNKAMIDGAHFTGYEEVSGYAYNLMLNNNDDISFASCEFDDFTSAETRLAHVLVNFNSKCSFRGSANVFNGTKDKYRPNAHGVIMNDSYFKNHSVSANFESMADTYVYTGVELTLEEMSLVWASVARGGVDVTGVIISDSSSAITGNVCELVYETTQHQRRSPAVVLNAGTYYLWVKRVGVTTDAATLTYRSFPITN